MAEKFFPFRVECEQRLDGQVWSSHEFRNVYNANRPKDKSWYAYDVVVKSPSLVEFIVYDMHDMCYGGLGKEIRRFEAKVHPELTRKSIERRAGMFALERRDRELVEQERAILLRYRDEILATLEAA
jgi:hypothetical protein